MLSSLYEQAEEGCQLGISVWGERALNDFYPIILEIAASTGVLPPVASRSPFHLYNKTDEIAEKVGWKVKLKWDQVNMFPYPDI